MIAIDEMAAITAIRMRRLRFLESVMMPAKYLPLDCLGRHSAAEVRDPG
jgi:hypothetical protein